MLKQPCLQHSCEKHNPGSDIKRPQPRSPFFSTKSLFPLKAENTTLSKGWRQEPNPGEHSCCRNTVAVVAEKCRPPWAGGKGGESLSETPTDRDLIPKISQRICRCPAQSIPQIEMGAAHPHWLLVKNRRDQRRKQTGQLFTHPQSPFPGNTHQRMAEPKHVFPDGECSLATITFPYGSLSEQTPSKNNRLGHQHNLFSDFAFKAFIIFVVALSVCLKFVFFCIMKFKDERPARGPFLTFSHILSTEYS